MRVSNFGEKMPNDYWATKARINLILEKTDTLQVTASINGLASGSSLRLRVTSLRSRTSNFKMEILAQRHLASRLRDRFEHRMNFITLNHYWTLILIGDMVNKLLSQWSKACLTTNIWMFLKYSNACFYNDVIMRAMASQITSLTFVYSNTDQRQHQIAAVLAFVMRIHRWPVNSLHKGPVTRKMFSFDDVVMQYVQMVANNRSMPLQCVPVLQCWFSPHTKAQPVWQC